MQEPSDPEDEDARLRALLETHLLDTPREAFLDECVALAAQLCGVSTAAVTLVDSERQWFKAIFGRLPSETPRSVSFCGHVVAHDDVMVVEDAAGDPRFADNPLVTEGLRIRFYAGVPLHGRDGQPIGTLCVIDEHPHQFDEQRLAPLLMIADKVEDYLSMRLLALRAAASAASAREREAALAKVEDERRALQAMLVHDLKNPLAAISLIADFASNAPEVPPRLREALADLAVSVDVMERMVLDALDISGADHGALKVTFAPFDMKQVLTRLAQRLRHLAAARGQSVEVKCELEDPTVTADSVLVARAVRNLLDNAFKYAPQDLPVQLVVRTAPADSVDIRVEDDGPSIPAEERDHIFDRNTRLERETARPSHGLGLAFCAVIASAHGGRAWVEPLAGGRGNAFVIRIPRVGTMPVETLPSSPARARSDRSGSTRS